MKPGDTVRQVVPVIAGTIIDTRYNKEINALEHLVSYSDDAGSHERWFNEDQLEAVQNG